MIFLPIDQHLEKIYQLSSGDVQNRKPFILTASPGSGKTTRLPAFLLRQLKNEIHAKKIIVIVPKRVSAVSAADRIADENGWTLGSEVGYQVRFEQKLTAHTQLIFMTEGLFLKRIQQESFWLDIHTLILDEFHERSSNLDLILGLAFERFLLNPDFNFIVMSATLNTDSLQKYFGESNLYQIEAPPHPLEIIYSDKTQKLTTDDQFYQALKEALSKAWKTSAKDILVFLPGYREIVKFKNIIFPNYPQNPIEILHGSIPLSEQKKIVQNTSTAGGLRRIILTTNVAESSITVNGIDCVIDSGLQKKSYIEPKLGFSGLDLERISLFSAKQRAGRAAREQKGYCFRLWHTIDELSMKEQNEPEILSSSLIEEILILKQQNVHNAQQFSWLTLPGQQKIKSAEKKLHRWELIDQDQKLTTKAKAVISWPLSIENSLIYFDLQHSLYQTDIAKLVTVLDSGKVEQIVNDIVTEDHDLQKICTANLSRYFLDKNLDQITKRCQTSEKYLGSKYQNIEDALIQVYLKYFPEKVCFRKNLTAGVSMYGRGTQTKTHSVLSKQDYYIVFHATETHAQSTQVLAGLGFDKKMALDLFSKYANKKSEIFYDFDKNDFYKNEKLVFETFILNDFGKTKLSDAEIKKQWKSFFQDNAETFLKSHHQYSELKTKLNFIEKNQTTYFKLSALALNQILEFEKLLSDLIIQFYNDFEDYKHSDLYHLSYQFLDESLSEAIQNLPNSIKSPKGKTATINYADDKAPLISLKLQDAFGWKDTPHIYHERIPLTLELLAPNMRPTQITSKLAQFWTTSYLDVRKELRARYPKHDWPEDPRS